MGKLKNARQELFAQGVAKGLTHAKAYLKAGYEAKDVDQGAHEIFSNLEVKARITEIIDKAESKTVLSVTERKEILSEIARGKTVDFLDESGCVKTDNVPNQRAINSVKVNERVYGVSGNVSRTRSLKLHDPIRAINELNKMEGVHSSTLEVEGSGMNLVQVIMPEKDKREGTDEENGKDDEDETRDNSGGA